MCILLPENKQCPAHLQSSSLVLGAVYTLFVSFYHILVYGRLFIPNSNFK